MNKKLRAFLEANGLRKDATDQEAWEKFDQLKTDGVELPTVDPGQRSAAGAATTVPASSTGAEVVVTPGETLTRSQAEEIARQAVQADIGRRNSITEALSLAGMTDHNGGTFARSLLDNGDITIDRARALIFAEMKTRAVPIGAGVHSSGFAVGLDAREKIRAAATDGLLMSCGRRLEKPAVGAADFRHMSMLDICRELLEANGVNTRGMSRMELSGRALASGSTSDLPFIFSSVVNENLLAAYAEYPSTWRPLVAVGSAMDFKTMYALKLSGSPDLQGLNENGEYKTAAFSDSGETYRVITKGLRVPFTREMIINDDRRALTRVPQLFAQAARRMESDAVYSLITTNGAMADSVALFHATHKNLAGTAAALASDALGLARAGMRKQTGLKGERLDILPQILLVPVALELAAEVLLRSSALPTANMSAGVANPWAGKLTPVAEPRLDDSSLTAWYLFASPGQAPVIEVAFLEGEEQPYVDQMIDFNSDAMIIKVRHDFGAGVVDHVGAYKNAGQ